MRTRNNLVDIKHQLNNNLQKQPLSVYLYSTIVCQLRIIITTKKKDCQTKCQILQKKMK